jgi:hypothetical protein
MSRNMLEAHGKEKETRLTYIEELIYKNTKKERVDIDNI